MKMRAGLGRVARVRVESTMTAPLMTKKRSTPAEKLGQARMAVSAPAAWRAW
jgi:hypothetical protein